MHVRHSWGCHGTAAMQRMLSLSVAVGMVVAGGALIDYEC